MVQNNRRSKTRISFVTHLLKQNISDTLKEYVIKVSIGGRNVTNLRFVDVIDTVAEEEKDVES